MASGSVSDDEKEVLTDRQRQALDFISRYISRRGFPPTLREIGTHMGIRSTNGVNDHLKALEKKGYLEREDLKSRALRPLDGAGGYGGSSGSGGNGAGHGSPELLALTGQLVEVPLLGRV